MPLLVSVGPVFYEAPARYYEVTSWPYRVGIYYRPCYIKVLHFTRVLTLFSMLSTSTPQEYVLGLLAYESHRPRPKVHIGQDYVAAVKAILLLVTKDKWDRNLGTYRVAYTSRLDKSLLPPTCCYPYSKSLGLFPQYPYTRVSLKQRYIPTYNTRLYIRALFESARHFTFAVLFTRIPTVLQHLDVTDGHT